MAKARDLAFSNDVFFAALASLAISARLVLASARHALLSSVLAPWPVVVSHSSLVVVDLTKEAGKGHPFTRDMTFPAYLKHSARALARKNNTVRNAASHARRD